MAEETPAYEAAQVLQRTRRRHQIVIEGLVQGLRSAELRNTITQYRQEVAALDLAITMFQQDPG